MSFISYNPGAPKRRGKVADTEWEKYRDDLKILYETHNLETIMKMMEEIHGFSATRRQYTQKFSDWGLVKNIPKDDMRVIARKNEERRLRGKASEVTWRGHQVGLEKLQRFQKRYSNDLDEGSRQRIIVGMSILLECNVFAAVRAIIYFCEKIQEKAKILATTQLPPYIRLATPPPSTSKHTLLDECYGCFPVLTEGACYNQQVGNPILDDFGDRLSAGRLTIAERFQSHFKMRLATTNSTDIAKLLAEIIPDEAPCHSMEPVCKFILKTYFPYSREGSHALVRGKGYMSALMRVIKRQEAFKSLSPFAIATLGFADSFIYCQGVLVYSLDDRIRILDLYNPGTHEVVVDLNKIIKHVNPSADSLDRGTSQVMSYFDKIVSFIFKSEEPGSVPYLIAFNIQNRTIAFSHVLESREKIFVRHNENFLFYGTHSGKRAEGFKLWEIQGFHFGESRFFVEKVYFPDVLDSEIGKTICFEIYGDYFYAVSSQTYIDPEEAKGKIDTDWNSFYHCARFPLDSPGQEFLDWADHSRMWRRHHREGPIDDRGTSLHMASDEREGKLMVVETRQEWLLGSSSSRRTPYVTDIVFSGVVQKLPRDGINHFHGSSSSNFVPDVSVKCPSKTRTGFYDCSTGVFLGLINDPPSSDGRCSQRIRLHGERMASSGIQRRNQRWDGNPPVKDFLDGEIGSSGISKLNLDTQSLVKHWSPEQYPANNEVNLDHLYTILNPPSHLGNVEGMTDERSIVYCTGSSDKPRAIIFVSFDPDLKLQGSRLFTWRGSSSAAEPIACINCDDSEPSRNVPKDTEVSITSRNFGATTRDEPPAINPLKRRRDSEGNYEPPNEVIE